jgi:DNA-binding NtrC family response regulator
MNAKTRILVVDDQEIVRLSLLRVLAGPNCEVETVFNGIDALREMERHPFDVVLLDLRMPGIDGMSVLRTIKEKWPESEVVVITGYPTIETAKEAIRLNAYDYLAKPVDPDDVIRVASGAMLHKTWSLHRDLTGQNEGMGARAGSH